MARRPAGLVTVERAGDDLWAPGGEPEPDRVGRIAAMVGTDHGCDFVMPSTGYMTTRP